MSAFADVLALRIVDYVRLRRSLGHVFQVQAATLSSFEKFVSVAAQADCGVDGPAL